MIIDSESDYIKRKEAYDSILNGMVMTGYQSRALDCISEFYVPAADVMPTIHGYWIVKYVTSSCNICACSNCHKQTSIIGRLYDYCPHCTAKMDGDNNKY